MTKGTYRRKGLFLFTVPERIHRAGSMKTSDRHCTGMRSWALAAGLNASMKQETKRR